jgi:recombination protein RecT
MSDQIAVAEKSEEKALTKITTYLESPIVKARFTQIMGERGASTYIASGLIAIGDSQALQKCTPPSLYLSLLRAATLKMSVDPSIGQAYLVPFGARATLIVGYKGLHDMAIRTGKYRYINAGPIYEGEEVVEDRISGFHKIAGMRASKEVIGWIAAFEMRDGYAKTLYMTVAEIHEHAQKYSKSYKSGPWQTETPKMEKKTVLRLLLRRWGYMDPSDTKILDEIEEEEPKGQEAEFNELSQAIDGRVVEEELPRSKDEAISQLGFGGNPDPIDEKSWDKWMTLIERAKAIGVPSAEPKRDTMTKADLRIAYSDLMGRVQDAEAQAASGEEAQ